MFRRLLTTTARSQKCAHHLSRSITTSSLRLQEEISTEEQRKKASKAQKIINAFQKQSQDPNFKEGDFSAKILENLAKEEAEEAKPVEPEFVAEPVPKPELFGTTETNKFKAETANLLKIVAESLYSDASIFIREFVSNASDAIEKCKFEEGLDKDFTITVNTDKEANTITFMDNGIGMTSDEIKSLLGTIAKSGTKAVKTGDNIDAATASNMIGQFGVGFYSSFMVGEKVEVYTKKHGAESGTYWLSEGVGEFTTQEAKNIEEGTRIVIHLKPEYAQYSEVDAVQEKLENTSSFTRYQIKLNGELLEMKKPIWTLPMREMDDDKHKELFNYLIGSTTNEEPRWNLHYVTDAPMSIKGMFYIPKGRPSMHEVQKMEGMDGDATCQLRLYSRNVMIQKNSSLLPRWLRFVRGVVDCEDLPLNVSRELLQDQALVSKLKQTITGRVIKWFQDKAKRRPEEYNQFFKDYKMFMAQGVMEQDNPQQRDQLSKLLRFESSSKPAGEMTSLDDYMKNMESSQDSIAYIYSSSREAAEKSPYYNVFKSKGLEVLLCYDTYDDMLLMNLNNFNGKPIKSAEQAAASIEDKQSVSDTGDANYQTVENLASWATNELAERAESVTISSTLTDYPAMVTGESLGMLRYYQRQAKMSQATNDGTNQETQMLKMMMGSMKPKLLLNPKHPIVHYAAEHRESDPDKAAAVVDHLMNWSMASAGLLDDTKEILDKTNDLVMTIIDAKKAEVKSEEKFEEKSEEKSEEKTEKIESEEKKTETS